MLKAIAAKQLPDFRRTLVAAFETGAERLTRTLSTPGGPIPRATVLHRPDADVWAYFSPTRFDNRRWLNWYGQYTGADGETVYPAIEINLSTDPSNRQIAGRSLVDEDGRYYLGHKGGLGGGRGGQLSISAFSALIQGFAREPIELSDGKEEPVFVIGELTAPDFLRRMHDYVVECRRLRQYIRQSRNDGLRDDFSPEHDVDGNGAGGFRDPYDIKRTHCRLVNALRRRLGTAWTNASNASMRPDLYLKRTDGRIDTLIEVKASSDTQSWFTALGQLVVYCAGQEPQPRRILICPAPLKNPAFHRGLAEVGGTLVTFKETADGFVFEGLDELGL